MSLFQCEQCGCVENTALCGYWSRSFDDNNPDNKKLCSVCDTNINLWHGKFERVFLPIGKFITNYVGNLEHTDTGSENYEQYKKHK